MGVLSKISGVLNSFDEWMTPNKRLHNYGPSTGGRPDYRPMNRLVSSDKSIVQAIYTRIAIDVAGVVYKHVELDAMGRLAADKDSRLNDALLHKPNIDQDPRAFRQDIVQTMLDSGVAIIVPVDTTRTPFGDLRDIYTMRVGNLMEVFHEHIRVSLYNEKTMTREAIVVEKRHVGVAYNPLYAVMNDTMGRLQRLQRKMGLLDTSDELAASGRLDIIIKLPYAVKSDARRQQAETRRGELDAQLKNSDLGIAYVDGTEDITQLNRPVESNLLKQVERLEEQVYADMGITAEIMNGTADEAAMLNYWNRTIEPFADAIAEAMRSAFVTEPRSKESIRYFRDPFKFVPLSQVAEIADKFTRNKIMTSNEFRDKVGLPPSDDPSADKLENSNMPEPTQVELVDRKQPPALVEGSPNNIEKGSQNGS